MAKSNPCFHVSGPDPPAPGVRWSSRFVPDGLRKNRLVNNGPVVCRRWTTRTVRADGPQLDCAS